MSKRIETIATALVILMGVVVLLGWQFDIDLLKRGFPGSPSTMKPNTALCFLLSGISLGLLQLELNIKKTKLKRRLQFFSFNTSCLIVFIALLTLSQYIWGWNLGIDRLLFRDTTPSVTTLYPGRMGESTALNFVLVGGILLLLGQKTQRGDWLAQIFSVLVVCLALLPLTGHLFGVAPFYELVVRATSTAPHTAATFIVLCVGILWFRPNRGLMQTLTSPLLGGIMARRLLPVMIIFPLLVNWLTFQAEQLGWYDTRFDFALRVAIMTPAFSILIWWIARSLNQIEHDRQQTEATLGESEERFRSTFEQAAVGISHVSLDGQFIRFNQRFSDIAGYPLSELATLTFQDITHPEDLTADLEQLQKLLAGEIQVYSMEKRYIRKDGSIVWVNLTVSLVRDRSGEPKYCIAVIEDITTRKQAETALLQLAAIVESASDGIIGKTLDGVIVSWNAGAEKLFGYAAEEIIGQSVLLLIPPERRYEETQFLEKLKRGERIEHYETVRQHKDGTFIHVSLTISPVKDTTGKIVGASKIARDISVRKRAETALKESEARFQAFMNNSPSAAWITDENGLLLYLSQTYLRTFQLPTDRIEDFIGKTVFEMYPTEIAQQFVDNIQRVTQTQQVLETIEKALRPDGSLGNFLVYKFPLAGESGQLLVGGVAVDITDRILAEQKLQQLNQELEARVEQRTAALRESEERWQLALQGSNDGIWDWNLKTNQMFVSTRWKEMWGFTENEIGDQVEERSSRIHPADRDRIFASIADHLAGKTLFYQEEYRVKCKDGSYIWVLDRGQALWDEAGNAIRMTGSESDISDRKRTEEKLRSLSERLTIALRSGGFGIWEYDFVQGKQIWDDRMYELYGVTPANFVNTFDSWLSHIHPDDRDQLLQTMQEVTETDKEYDTEFRIVQPSGEIRFLKTSGILQRDNQGKALRIIGVNSDITDRKLAEEAMRESEHRFATLAEAAPVGIFRFDTASNCIYVNERGSEMTGRPRQAMLGMGWLETVHPEDRHPVSLAWSEAFQQENFYRSESRFLRPDGSIIWYYCQALPETNLNGTTIGYIGTLTDITARKNAEQELIRNWDLREAIFNESADALFLVDSETRLNLDCNRRAVELFEAANKPELLGIEGNTFQYNQFSPEELAAISLELQSKGFWSREVEYLTRKGNLFWGNIAAKPIAVAGRTLNLVRVTDISDRKQAEAALAKYAREVEDLYNNAPCGYHSLDIEGRFLSVNNTEMQWLGYTREELIGKPLTNFLSEASRSFFRENYSRFQAQGRLKDIELDLICKDGTLFPVLVDAIVVKSVDGQYLYSRSTLFDLRDRKQAEQTLQELNTAMQNAVEGISRIDTDGRYRSMNRAYANMCGYEPEELIGQSWHQTVYSDDIPNMLATYQQMIQSGKVEAETRGLRKDGSIFYKQVMMITSHDRDGNVTGNHCFLKDISDRKYAEVQLRQTNEQLVRATRLKDEFLANMSHELRTPLNAILGMSEGLQEGVFGSVNERQVNAIATIERSGKHLLELINDILDLSKIESGKLELQISDVPVKSLCNASLAFIKQMALEKNIHLNTHIPNNLGSIQADDRRLRQLLINLLSNAVKFTPEGGSVTLEVRLEQEAQAQKIQETISGTSSFSPLSPDIPISPSTPHLCFSIIDTGIGIAPENLDKLFQAFVQIDSSLNRQYTGTGLGLTLVQQLAALHGGTVSVRSGVGQGSCFTVRIPYHSTDEVARKQVITPLPSYSFPANNDRVLIIEDSNPAAEQIARYLNEYGLQSILYQHGEGAFAEALRLQPALVILDIQLPDLSGWNVLTQLKTHPHTRDIPVLIVSVVDEPSKALAMGASEYLVKPVTRNDFQAVLKKLQCPIIPQSGTLIDTPAPVPESSLILLAEDNQANIDTISGYLESRGYRLIVAKDGQQAIELVKCQRPDLILMDIQMPGMDGLEAMRCIRTEGYAQVPIIAITALAMPGDREKCLEAGANEYLTKPIKLKQLAATIQQLLQRNSNLR